MWILTTNITDINEETYCAYHLQMLEWVDKIWVLGNWKQPDFFFHLVNYEMILKTDNSD